VVVHVVQAAPQCAGSVLVLNAQGVVPPHALNAPVHVAPQTPAVHDGVPFVTVGHCVQLAPQ
jgi:hypothetical protein